MNQTDIERQAYEAWCFFAGKGTEVPEHRREFDSGMAVEVSPLDLCAYFEIVLMGGGDRTIHESPNFKP